MSEKNKKIDEIIRNSGRMYRALHLIFPGAVRNLAESQLAEEAEVQRREELGPKGRILEDAEKAVIISGHGGKPEFSRISPIEAVLKKFRSADDRNNVLRVNNSEDYGFRGLADKHDVLARDTEGELRLCLVGYRLAPNFHDNYIVGQVELNDEFLSSLNEEDLEILEAAAAHSLDVARDTEIWLRNLTT